MSGLDKVLVVVQVVRDPLVSALWRSEKGWKEGFGDTLESSCTCWSCSGSKGVTASCKAACVSNAWDSQPTSPLRSCLWGVLGMHSKAAGLKLIKSFQL